MRQNRRFRCEFLVKNHLIGPVFDLFTVLLYNALAWQLVDVYIGFVLFSGWIIYRKSVVRSIVWVVLAMILATLQPA
jgi:hypothetical protein